MKLDYFDLLSPEPIYFHYIGGVKCPTLREISKLSYHTYEMYLSLLLMTPQTYFSMAQASESYQAMSEEEAASLHIFDLITQDRQMRSLIESVLDFFLVYTPKYSEEQKAFLLYEDNASDKPSGVIQKALWPQLCDIILQRNYIKTQKEDISKVKNKRALSIMKKLERGREQQEKKRKKDKNMDIGNIISAVANKSTSLNIVTVWDMTIYQLWDTFYRICNNNIYDIQSISVAAYGNKDHSFDPNSWFQNLNKKD